MWERTVWIGKNINVESARIWKATFKKSCVQIALLTRQKNTGVERNICRPNRKEAFCGDKG